MRPPRVSPYPKTSSYAKLSPYQLHVQWAKFRIADKQLREVGLRNNECRRVTDTLERLLKSRRQQDR